MTIDPICLYLTDAAIALATKTTGQMAMNTIIPNAISSDKLMGCARYV
jgi:hypothetical protein